MLVSALECRRALLLVCKLDGSNVCAPCPFTANPLRILIIDHVFKSVAEQVYYSPAPSCQLVRTSLTGILRNWQDGWTCIVIASTGDCGEVQMCRCQKNAGAEDFLGTRRWSLGTQIGDTYWAKCDLGTPPRLGF